MYDNIGIKFENAEKYINFFNAVFIIKELKQRIKKEGESAQLYAFLSNAYSAIFDDSLSLRYALKSIKLNKKYAYAYFLAGLAYLNGNKYEKSLKYLEKSLKYGGNDYYFPLFGLVLYYLEVEDIKKYYEYANKFFAVKSDYPDYFWMSAYIKYMFSLKMEDCSKDILRSIKSFYKYRNFTSIFSILILWLVFLFVRLFFIIFKGEFLRLERLKYFVFNDGDAKAYEMYKGLGQKNKKQKDMLYREILDAYFYMEQYEKCIALANKFLVEHKSAYILMYKARSYNCLGKLDKAIKTLDKAREYDNEIQLHNYSYWKAKFHYDSGKFNEALKYINQQIISDTEPDVDNYIFKAKCFYMLDNNVEAIANFLIALKFDDGSSADEICWWIANIYYLMKDYDNALVYVDIALLENKDFYNYNLKGDILTSLKRIKEANDCYKKAAKYL